MARITGWIFGLAPLSLAGFQTPPAGEPNRDYCQKAWHYGGPSLPPIEAAIVTDLSSHAVYRASLGGGILKSVYGGNTFLATSKRLPAKPVPAPIVTDQNHH